MPQPLNGASFRARLRESWSLPRTPNAIARDLIGGAIGCAILTLPFWSLLIVVYENDYIHDLPLAPWMALPVMALWAIAAGLFTLYGNYGVLPRIVVLVIWAAIIVAKANVLFFVGFLIAASVFTVILLMAAIAAYGALPILGVVFWFVLLLYGPMAVAGWAAARHVLSVRPT
ncbi:hypothetical protein [Falsirhodobacter halotolerans]|uniref:hypothetical protein n=1 Tax=Falsirhodobacter halotolerans TaxID=1146892 RepID=UPI001FD405B8|nr:hypothetical protein [Falsirhodobacter halotolerans]MCJ8140134.1 hypothetical protein [Falsirhodobacter halotolerans]